MNDLPWIPHETSMIAVRTISFSRVLQTEIVTQLVDLNAHFVDVDVLAITV